MPARIVNRVIEAIARSPLHALLGAGIAVIVVEGSKTGHTYSTPINVIRDGDHYTVMSLRKRTWWRNLKGDRAARLWIAGRPADVRGAVVENSAEVRRGLEELFSQHPAYARYFGVRLDAAKQPLPADLDRAADERVIVRLRPYPSTAAAM